MCPLQSTACAANKDGGQINVCKRYYTINHDHYETKLELFFSFFGGIAEVLFFPRLCSPTTTSPVVACSVTYQHLRVCTG